MSRTWPASAGQYEASRTALPTMAAPYRPGRSTGRDGDDTQTLKDYGLDHVLPGDRHRGQAQPDQGERHHAIADRGHPDRRPRAPGWLQQEPLRKGGLAGPSGRGRAGRPRLAGGVPGRPRLGAPDRTGHQRERRDIRGLTASWSTLRVT